MEWLSRAVAWISENESALSGVAAMIVVAGVIFTPLRRLLGLRSSGTRVANTPQPGPAEGGESSREHEARPSIAVLPFANL
jgi:hypothetical protein